MLRIATIVEGRGEVAALPKLLGRIANQVAPGLRVALPRPLRVARNRILKPGELERYIRMAAADAGVNGCILILLDADRDCPAELAAEILERATTERADLRIRAVAANPEYESWFLAAIESVASHLGTAASRPDDPESIRDAKGWLSSSMPTGRKYRPTIHQARFTAALDLHAARSAPSFDKLWRDVTSLLVSAPASKSE